MTCVGKAATSMTCINLNFKILCLLGLGKQGVEELLSDAGGTANKSRTRDY